MFGKGGGNEGGLGSFIAGTCHFSASDHYIIDQALRLGILHIP